MKFIYPAVFRQTTDGTYEGFFPDLECCYARGESLEDAIEDANAAACSWIEVELEDENGQLPPVSDWNDIPLQEGDILRNISVTIRFTDGWDE
ncbi:MAG TPA: type II toxin-antitoxin system HicB family antitoxin [Candidatus Blautia gallistercoris]|uniref:Type II toxin-antitoxin system HicB family antitoxin n=1 Tax=Candidatus Blautia gallistercoris TaxID=2838490 RepID=A0A9D1WH63_9FIRM|nr:type II toxin-antitoxin system HicB family antitoxin [Candidatus Blautia gallistercoris]